MQTWRSLLRQLMVQGYVEVDHEGYGALTLTDASRPLLRGEVGIKVREDTKTPAPRKKARSAPGDIPAADQALWEALRECRRQLAVAQNVPPYVIFHDATLRHMLRERPTDPEALLEISGVGQAKLERYGERFLEVVRQAG